ncbi:hypothetical protein EVAR_6616_1 [Eumeta japonica]|uniref:Uncharacterized protein n=1 Tax=Eumeta variegata TaxID=151549 RepID=A0A4C1TLN0_EUMVA|nr:hypothetical protein EVAR_6616_1 [Eumeta japonica]
MKVNSQNKVSIDARTPGGQRDLRGGRRTLVRDGADERGAAGQRSGFKSGEIRAPKRESGQPPEVAECAAATATFSVRTRELCVRRACTAATGQGKTRRRSRGAEDPTAAPPPPPPPARLAAASHRRFTTCDSISSAVRADLGVHRALPFAAHAQCTRRIFVRDAFGSILLDEITIH